MSCRRKPAPSTPGGLSQAGVLPRGNVYPTPISLSDSNFPEVAVLGPGVRRGDGSEQAALPSRCHAGESRHPVRPAGNGNVYPTPISLPRGNVYLTPISPTLRYWAPAFAGVTARNRPPPITMSCRRKPAPSTPGGKCVSDRNPPPARPPGRAFDRTGPAIRRRASLVRSHPGSSEMSATSRQIRSSRRSRARRLARTVGSSAMTMTSVKKASTGPFSPASCVSRAA